MKIIRCTLAAGAITVLLTIALLLFRPPEGNGYMSGQGAFILELVGFGIFFFCISWFPSMFVGFFISRKSMTEPQKSAHLTVTVISAVVFLGMVSFVTNMIWRHPPP